MRRVRVGLVGLLLGTLAAAGFLRAAEPDAEPLRAQFLRWCEVACNDLNSPSRKAPFYIDAYAVRALGVAYDLSGESRYLDVCRAWSDRMVRFQKEMRPPGAYYMHYGRKPGETNGHWYVADSSSIGLGILATAVRCTDKAEKKRYQDSVRSFARLAIDHYLGPGGGIRNGLWPKFDGEWWCCSGIFGSLCFLLYDETGTTLYRDAGFGAIAWLNRQDLESTGPYPLREMGPALPMYTFEAYSAALPWLAQRPELRQAATRQIQWFLKWTAENVPTEGDGRQWKYASHWGSKFGGLPFHLCVYARSLPGCEAAGRAADREFRHLATQLPASPPQTSLSQLAAFSMMSWAEKLSPGGIYRTSHLDPLRSPKAEPPRAPGARAD